MNNSNQQVDINQKIAYLHQKIDLINTQLKASGRFELKMKFIDFVDNTIERLALVDHKMPNKEIVDKKYQEYYNAQENERERRRIQMEKEDMSKRLKDLSHKQRDLELQSLKIQVQNLQINKHHIIQEASNKEKQLKLYVFQTQKKIKAQEKELQKLIRVNNMQNKQIDTLKEERNRAEKNQLAWKERYDRQIGLLETFNEKGSKYMYRHQDGLRVLRTITNITTKQKGCQRYFLCQLPIKFHIIKIVYGIKLGILQPNRQIIFINQMTLSIQDNILTLVHIKRKLVTKLEGYKSDGKIVLMMYGKGDSIAIDQNN